MGKENYPQVYLEEGKYKAKKIKTRRNASFDKKQTTEFMFQTYVSIIDYF